MDAADEAASAPNQAGFDPCGHFESTAPFFFAQDSESVPRVKLHIYMSTTFFSRFFFIDGLMDMVLKFGLVS